MSDLNKGDVVSFNHKGKRSIGTLERLPEETPESVYEISDFLLDETVKVPAGTLVREAISDEKFRVFVVQKEKDNEWFDTESFRLIDEAKEFEKSLEEDSRIISDFIQL